MRRGPLVLVLLVMALTVALAWPRSCSSARETTNERRTLAALAAELAAQGGARQRVILVPQTDAGFVILKGDSSAFPPGLGEADLVGPRPSAAPR